MDQMVSHFTSKRPTQRWTYAFFCNILDIMALAAYCICKENTAGKLKGGRKSFLLDLSDSLVRPNIEKRINNANVMSNHSTRMAIVAVTGKTIQAPTIINSSSGAKVLEIKKCCQICRDGKNKIQRKTRYVCGTCSEPVCQQHSNIIYSCFKCNN